MEIEIEVEFKYLLIQSKGKRVIFPNFVQWNSKTDKDYKIFQEIWIKLQKDLDIIMHTAQWRGIDPCHKIHKMMLEVIKKKILYDR